MIRRLTILIVMMSGLNACQKSIEEFTPYSGQPSTADSVWVFNISDSSPVFSLRNDLRIPLSTNNESIQSGTTNSFNLSSGLTVSIPSGNLTVPGTNTPVTGPVIIYSYWLRTKGDMIRMGTGGLSSNGHLLQSAGQFFVRFRNNAGWLIPSPGTDLNIRFQNPTSLPPNTGLYHEEPGVNIWDYRWAPETRGRIEAYAGNNYQIHTSFTGWLQAATQADSVPGNISIQVALTPYNTNANTLAFLVFDDINTVLPLMPNINSRVFSIGNIHPNRQAKLVVISKMGNNYYWGAESIITGAAATQNTQTVSVTPRLTSLNNIIYNLNNL